MLERADTSEAIDLNTLALSLYSMICGTSASKREPDPSAIILFHHSDREICRILEDEHEHDSSTSALDALLRRRTVSVCSVLKSAKRDASPTYGDRAGAYRDCVLVRGQKKTHTWAYRL